MMLDAIFSLADQLVGRGVLKNYGVRIHVGQHGSVNVGLKGDQEVSGILVRMLPLRDPTTGKAIKGTDAIRPGGAFEEALKCAITNLEYQILDAYFDDDFPAHAPKVAADAHLEEQYDDSQTGGGE